MHFSRLFCAIVLLLGCHVGTPLTAADANPELKLVTDFSDVAVRDDSHSTIYLRFMDIRPMPGDRGHGDVVVSLVRRGDSWAEKGHNAAADYNQRSTNTIDGIDLKFDGQDLTGSVKVTINRDAPRPGDNNPHMGPAPFPARYDAKTRKIVNEPDIYEVEITAKRTKEPAPYIDDTERHEPPWRKDTPMFGGDAIEGTFTAKRGEETVTGRVIGAVSPDAKPGLISLNDNIHVTKRDAGGLDVLARLPRTRAAAYTSAMAWLTLPQPQDWSRFTTLRVTVTSESRRDEVGIQLALRTAGGTHDENNAALLLGRTATFDIPLRDFTGDLKSVQALGFGASNPFGVGDVRFTLHRIELVPATDAATADATEPKTAVIRIDPSTNIVFNGAGEVPKGLFGHHDINGNKPRKPREGELDVVAYTAAINPGYLRPLDHVGFGGSPITDEEIKAKIEARLGRDEPTNIYYQRAKAGNAVDNIVWCHTVDLFSRPAWMDQGIDAWVERVHAFYRHQGANAWVPGDEYNLLRRLEVWNEPFFWGRHTNMNHRLPPGRKDWIDPTQYGYIPGELGAEVYSRFFKAAVEGAKSANPHVKLGGPSAPAFSGDSFGVLENYVRHFIDDCHEQIDFLTEHHYGGNPRTPAASYDVITAYSDTKYNKRYPIYNTEANLLGASDNWVANYNMVDILTCLQQNPDVVVGRALHGLWSGYLRNPGEEHAYLMLAPLRGKRIKVDFDMPGIIVEATNPSDDTLIVLAHNSTGSDQPVTLDIPAGFVLSEIAVMVTKGPQRQVDFGDTEGAAVPTPEAGRSTLEVRSGEDLDPARDVHANIPGFSAVRWTLTRPDYRPTRVAVTQQSFADAVLTWVRPGEDVTSKVLWRGDLKPADARAATLRVVTADVHQDEAIAVINGKSYTLPRSGDAGDAVIQEMAIDLADLKDETTITFRVADPDRQNGYRVLSASVLLHK